MCQVFQLGVCPVCTERLAAANNAADAQVFHDGRYLFLQHVARVARHVVKDGRTPIIWDDMLRSLGKTDIKESGIGSLVEPMVWVYIEDIDRWRYCILCPPNIGTTEGGYFYRFIDSMTWRTYAEIFPGIWTASAYKESILF